MGELSGNDARGQALGQIESAIQQDDPVQLGDGLLELIRSEPMRWREIALLEGVFPDANTTDWQKRFPVFLKAVEYVLESGAMPNIAVTLRASKNGHCQA
jgi:hypothetical protein